MKIFLVLVFRYMFSGLAYLGSKLYFIISSNKNSPFGTFFIASSTFCRALRCPASRLHVAQARVIFRRSSRPFPARGTICSIVAVSSVSVAPQYMQFHPSRFAIEFTSNLRLEALRGFRSRLRSSCAFSGSTGEHQKPHSCLS